MNDFFSNLKKIKDVVDQVKDVAQKSGITKSSATSVTAAPSTSNQVAQKTGHKTMNLSMRQCKIIDSWPYHEVVFGSVKRKKRPPK